jgi:DNA sulfur modification protein DndD
VIIERIEIENFGPYYERQILDLGSGDHPLVVIHGENMSGKTSLLNAVRWGLYGYAKDRGGRPMPVRNLINDDAYAEGNRRVSVRLHIRTAEDKAVVLRRQRQLRSQGTNGSKDADFEEVLAVEVDGDVLPQSQFDDLVNTLLPEDISRFFLFDGELLNEYEDLVREGGDQSALRVKQSIEMILGVPAARRGRDDVRTLLASAERKYNREAKKDAESSEAAEALESELASQEGRARDVEALGNQLENVQSDVRHLESELKRYDELREDVGRLEALRQSQKESEAREKQLMADRRTHVAQLWRDALKPRLDHELDRLDRERSEIEVALNDLYYTEHRVADLKAAVAEKICKTCGQAMPEEAAARIQAELVDATRAVEALKSKADPKRLQEIAGTIKHLRDIVPAGVEEAIAQIERDLGVLRLETYKNAQKESLLVERLKDVDPDKILEHESKRNSLLRHAAKIQVELDRKQQESSEAESRIAALRRQLREKDLPALRRLRREVEILERLDVLFDAAIQELINDLRARVEVEATDIFKQLTTDKSYSGLQINEMYGLTILDARGKTVTVRSAGAEQVVALSLIGALNRLAIRKGPVIMDTPFGRLDVKHRANILRFVPTLAEQVVLLVHGGEINRERDLTEVASMIDEEYRIDHLTSQRSALVRIKEASVVR